MSIRSWFRALFGAGGKPFPAVTHVLVGLGNIGSEYAGTRHNIGFSVVDACVKTLKNPAEPGLSHAVVTTGRLTAHAAVAAAKPVTLMNRSGIAVRELIQVTGIEPSRCLVIVDDFHLPLGTIRFRKQGSDGGHNGLKSVQSVLGPDYPRLRIGIGPKPSAESIIDFVLGRFTEEEEKMLQPVIARAYQGVCAFCEDGVETAMSRFNSR